LRKSANGWDDWNVTQDGSRTITDGCEPLILPATVSSGIWVQDVVGSNPAAPTKTTFPPPIYFT
jgi:hypothetical protein